MDETFRVMSPSSDPDLQESWERDGYIVRRGLFDKMEVMQLRRHCADVLSGIYESGRPPLIDPFLRRRNSQATQIVDNPHWANRIIRDLAMDARIGRVAALLLKAARVRLWATQFLHKPPGGLQEGVIGWHQDYDYWECASPTIVTAWLPLDDTSTENGTMSVIAGSHRAGHFRIKSFLDFDLPKQRTAFRAMASDLSERHLTLQVGDVSFHHCLTLHASGQNASTEPRRALSVHIMADGTSYRAGSTCDHHPNVILLGSPNGTLFQGRHFPILPLE